ncbi:hypothetical protein HDU76_008856 [Blyttiomyces sp. JEL0837]|nr:hypothetical protein HDU76_008856 [Blyttiomyces sp. JEL0837]
MKAPITQDTTASSPPPVIAACGGGFVKGFPGLRNGPVQVAGAVQITYSNHRKPKLEYLAVTFDGIFVVPGTLTVGKTSTQQQSPSRATSPTSSSSALQQPTASAITSSSATEQDKEYRLIQKERILIKTEIPIALTDPSLAFISQPVIGGNITHHSSQSNLSNNASHSSLTSSSHSSLFSTAGAMRSISIPFKIDLTADEAASLPPSAKIDIRSEKPGDNKTASTAAKGAEDTSTYGVQYTLSVFARFSGTFEDTEVSADISIPWPRFQPDVIMKVLAPPQAKDADDKGKSPEKVVPSGSEATTDENQVAKTADSPRPSTFKASVIRKTGKWLDDIFQWSWEINADVGYFGHVNTLTFEIDRLKDANHALIGDEEIIIEVILHEKWVWEHIDAKGERIRVIARATVDNLHASTIRKLLEVVIPTDALPTIRLKPLNVTHRLKVSIRHVNPSKPSKEQSNIISSADIGLPVASFSVEDLNALLSTSPSFLPPDMRDLVTAAAERRGLGGSKSDAINALSGALAASSLVGKSVSVDDQLDADPASPRKKSGLESVFASFRLPRSGQ